MARGHRIEQVAQVPLVVSDNVQGLQKTKAALALLKQIGAGDDCERVRLTRHIRKGRGKMRNRRHVQRRGPLIVYNEDQGIVKAVRNLPGVDTAHVSRLNLLQLAPGGHLGRFIIWTKSAFSALNEIYGSVNRESTSKKGYKLPRNIMTNSDLSRIINSDEVQSKLRAKQTTVVRRQQKKNPLKNLGVKVRLNPYALVLRRNELKAQQLRASKKEEILAKIRAAKKAGAKAHSATALKTFYRITKDDSTKEEPKAAEPKKEEPKAAAPAAKAAAAPAKAAAAPAKKEAEKPAAKAAAPAAKAAAPAAKGKKAPEPEPEEADEENDEEAE